MSATADPKRKMIMFYSNDMRIEAFDSLVTALTDSLPKFEGALKEFAKDYNTDTVSPVLPVINASCFEDAPFTDRVTAWVTLSDNTMLKQAYVATAVLSAKDYLDGERPMTEGALNAASSAIAVLLSTNDLTAFAAAAQLSNNVVGQANEVQLPATDFAVAIVEAIEQTRQTFDIAAASDWVTTVCSIILSDSERMDTFWKAEV